MGWFDDPDETGPAIAQALDIAKNKPLPATARSRTEAEHAHHFRIVGCIVGAIMAVLLGGLLLAMALADSRQTREAFPVALLIALLAFPGVYLAVRWRMNRGGKYRDPGIAVDVGVAGITVRGPGGHFAMHWHEIEAQVNWMSVRHGVHFLGLRIESPLGLIDLKEERYVGGRATAALIVRGMHDDYWARERDKVERVV